MNRNQPTTYIDLNGEDADILEAEESVDSSNTLTSAYAELGKAFYEYRFEEPTPELLLYFDRITELLKTTKEVKRQREEHIEPMAAKTASKGDYKIDTTPVSAPAVEKTPFGFQETPIPEVNRFSDPFSQNYSNGPIPDTPDSLQSSWEEPQNLENNFWKNTQDVMGEQKTFVISEPQPTQPSTPSSPQPEKRKKGAFSPFRKKEKDRVSSFDDLPSINKGDNGFLQSPEPTSPSQGSFCPVCGTPVGPDDGFCGNCGTRLVH